MKHPNNISYKDIERQATRAGLEIRNGKGDHAVIRDPRTGQSMTYCRREMGTGLKRKVIKWLIAAGVSFGVILCILPLLPLM